MLPQWLLFFATAFLIFMLGRVFLFFQYTDDVLRDSYRIDIVPLFIKGALFDIKSASIIVAFPVLLGMLSLVSERIIKKLYLIQPHFLASLLTVILALTLGNVFYFSVYGGPFDIFIFGLLEDDTAAVLKTIWRDYPVVWLLIVISVFYGFFSLIFNKLPCPCISRFAYSYRHSSWANAGLILLIIVSLVAGIRASFGKFPLRKSSAQISASTVFNKLVPNSVTALGWAVDEYKNSNVFQPVSMEEGKVLFQKLLNKPTKVDLAELQVVTPTNRMLEADKPNVAFVIMESMSSHLFQFDKPGRDLFGRLRPHFKEGWTFWNFVSEGDGTADTMHRLFIRSPINNISQSKAKNKQFASNIFQPYIDAGYRIVYVTAGNGGWRDFDQFTKHLGVDEFVDENMLRHLYPDAKADTWGIPDEYMFRYAEDRLKQAENENVPIFMMLLSITHHPPYRLPDSPEAKRQSFSFDEQELQRLSRLGNEKEINEIFNTFHYANDVLGGFLTKTQQKGKTILAVTGDHNMRGIGYAKAEELVLGHAVPFYLYVPEQYRNQAVYQSDRVGSHKDIMPTLYELSLSNRTYFRTGCNLTAVSIDDNPWCGYGYNSEVVLLENGGFNLNNGTFRNWADQDMLRLSEQTSVLNQQDEEKASRGQYYGEFLNWLINFMVSGQKQ